MRARRVLLVPALVLSGVMASGGAALAVTGGNDVADGDLPFVAKLAIGDTERACSGVLVHPQLVLTAAACFTRDDGSTPGGTPQRPTTVTVGRAGLSGSTGAVVPVRDIVVNAAAGVVLARLDTPVTSVPPVKLAASAPQAGDRVTIAGYGRTGDEWVPSRLKSAAAAVDTVGAGSFELVPVGSGSGGVCKGDAGGPALRFNGTAIELLGVHTSSNQQGCVGESATTTPRATEARVDTLASWITGRFPGFATSFEASDPRPNWKSTVGTEAHHGGLLNVTGVCCNLTGPELFTGVNPAGSHTGSTSIMYSGKDADATKSYAYTKMFRLRNAQVRQSTTLSYWIYPQSKANSFNYADGNNSMCVAIDIVFTDGSTLRDSGAVDQNGHSVHPGGQCNTMVLDTWQQVVVRLGDWTAGKTINTISVAYDQGPNTGGYRGFVDDVAITDLITTDKFNTGLEAGQTALTWTNTVSSTKPGGSLQNVEGVCCSLTGPETKLQEDTVRAHGGTKVILYSGKDMKGGSGDKSFAYTKAFGPSDIFVTPQTKLAYWIYPQSKENSNNNASGNNSKCVALDLILTDNFDATAKSLRDSGATDQNNRSIHPAQQCNQLVLDKWNYVEVPLGAVANGKQITQIDLGYDQAPNTGGYRGYVDDVRIIE